MKNFTIEKTKIEQNRIFPTRNEDLLKKTKGKKNDKIKIEVLNPSMVLATVNK